MDKLGNQIYLTLPHEDDKGDVEYKWNLATMNEYKQAKITSQMRWRVEEASTRESALYILGVHDEGYLTGLPRGDLIATYLNLIECARQLNLYTCLRVFKKIEGSDSYWAVMQVFKSETLNVKYDYDLPQIPEHLLPDYLPN